MKKIIILLLIGFIAPAFAQIGVNDEYILTTITLKDKSEKVIAMKNLAITNPDGTVAASGKTDVNGAFKTKLKRGVKYTVYFVEGGQDWYFEVPISTDPTAAYFMTSCKVLVDQGAAATIPVSERTCNVVVEITSGDKPMVGQKFSLENISGDKIGEYITDDRGQSSVKLKQGLKMVLRTTANGATYSSNMTVPSLDKTIFEIAIPVAGATNVPDENAGKCKVNFVVTDDIGVAEGTAVIKLKLNDQLLFTGQTDIEGKCTTWVEQHKIYDVFVEKFGKSFSLKLELPADSRLSEFDCMVRIKVIEEYTRTYTLENVYFDVDKWDLKPASFPALDQLYKAMNTSPSMTIELAGHTDSDGDDVHNMTLSQRRADAVKKYLTDKGISTNRILTKGYGEKVPLVDNNTDANKAKNRRTEVRVISE